MKVFGRIRPFISFEQHHKKSCIETTEDTIYVVGVSTQANAMKCPYGIDKLLALSTTHRIRHREERQHRSPLIEYLE